MNANLIASIQTALIIQSAVFLSIGWPLTLVANHASIWHGGGLILQISAVAMLLLAWRLQRIGENAR